MVFSACALISMVRNNSRAKGWPTRHILSIENDVAMTSSFPKGTKMHSTYTHLPVRNVRNTDIGMQLVISGAVP